MASNDLKLEGRIPKNIADELHRRGYPVRSVEDYTDTMGHAGAILVDQAKRSASGQLIPWQRACRRLLAIAEQE